MLRSLRLGWGKIQKAMRRNSQGFTLIEVLMALSILSVALLTLAQMSVIAIRGNAVSAKLTQAITVTQDKLEELKNLTYSQIIATANGTDTFGVITRSWTITTPTPGLAQVQVTTTWTDMNRKARTIILTTEVTQ